MLLQTFVSVSVLPSNYINFNSSKGRGRALQLGLTRIKLAARKCL